MTLEQQVRNILESAGVEDAQSLTPGDLLEAANLLNGIVRQTRREALEEAEHVATESCGCAADIRALMEKEPSG